MGPEAGEGQAGSTSLRTRTLILGIILVPLLCIAVEYGELVERAGEMVSTSLMLVVTCLLLLFLAINALLRRRKAGRGLSRADLLYLFVMLTAAGNIAGAGMMQFLVPMLGHIFYYASPANRWAQFHPYVPTWLVPDQSVLPGYYDGQTTFFTAAHLQGWLQPLVTWSALIGRN